MVPIILTLLGGVIAGYGGKKIIDSRNESRGSLKAKSIIDEAKQKAKNITLEAKEQSLLEIDKIKAETSHQNEQAMSEIKEEKNRLSDLDKRLLSKEQSLDNKAKDLDGKSESLKNYEVEINDIKLEIKEIRNKQLERLEKLSGIKKDEAAQKLMALTEKEIKEDLVLLIEKLKREAKETADDYARQVVSDAMQRIAAEQTAEKTITTVDIPSEDIKGKIIGKEGRNIQAFEKATGIEVIFDETPNVVILSGFDPVRRQVARVALEMLVKDGRINPAKIEEAVEKANKEIDNIIKKAAQEACRETGVAPLPPQIMHYLGQLKFRTSFGQNVLKHSVEMSQIAAMVAAEIGADVMVCRVAALVHDLGKAVTHEMDGNHHHLTRTLCEKYGMPENIIHAAEAHHDDIEATTVEALVVRAVDALSAGRPGARGDNPVNFTKRMTELENIANSFDGVVKSYAISAGREIRVFVTPESVDDLMAIRLAREIANKIESNLRFPGTVKVNVIRETRAVEFAK
jgi:ribonuclease Y